MDVLQAEVDGLVMDGVQSPLVSVARKRIDFRIVEIKTGHLNWRRIKFRETRSIAHF